MTPTFITHFLLTNEIRRNCKWIFIRFFFYIFNCLKAWNTAPGFWNFPREGDSSCVFFSGLWHRVVQYLVTNVLKECSVSIFRVETCSNRFLDSVDKHLRFSTAPKSTKPQVQPSVISECSLNFLDHTCL